MEPCNADHIRKRFLEKSPKNGRDIFANGNIASQASTPLRMVSSDPSADNDQYYINRDNQKKGIMSASEIVRLFGIIAPLTMRNNNYKEAKNNVIWQGMYLRTDRSMFMVNIAGAVMLTLLPTYPCHYCGLIQPEDEIEVDHRQPKSGPMGWGVAKVLHSLNAGLTTAGASGHKNTDLLTSPPRINPKGWQRGVPWVSYDFTRKRDRYTLTDKGRTFLTVACMVYGIGEAGFPSICINSLFNLVPSCGSCNRTKGRITFVHKS